MRRRFIPRQERMDSEEPPNVRVACSGDIDEVVRLMHDAAAWMSAKGTPAWDVARIDRTFAGDLRPGSELPSRELQRRHRRLLHLVGRIEFWPTPSGEAAYLHKLAVRRTHAGRGVSSRADRGLPPCRANAGVRQAAARLPPEPAWPIRAAPDSPTSTLSIPAGIQPSSQNASRTRNLTSVRASRSMSGWDGPVASRSLAVRPRCLGLREGCRQAMLECAMVDRFLAALHGDDAAAISLKCASSPMVPSLRVSR